MKKLTLNILLLILLLTVLPTDIVNTSWPASAGNGISYLDEDPNEPEPESVFIGSLIDCLDEDPNEPEPESVYIGGLISCLDEEPNEPEPESI